MSLFASKPSLCMGMSDAMGKEPLRLRLLERTFGWPFSHALSMRWVLGMAWPALVLGTVDFEFISGVDWACAVIVESWRSSFFGPGKLTGDGAGRAGRDGGGAAGEAEEQLRVLTGRGW